MSQIDKVTYLPILVWFWLYCGCLYVLLYFYTIRWLHQSLRLRGLYINSLFKDSINIFFFFRIVCLIFINSILYTYFKRFSICWKGIKIVLSKYNFFVFKRGRFLLKSN